jgi:2'-5' RNA ligase
MPPRNPVHRLFVGVYPPPLAAAELLRLLDRLDLPPHRATRPDQLHLTLLFIGDRHERDLDEVAESVARSVAGIDPFQLTPTRLVTLPERGAARLVAVETDAPPGLLEIQRRLAHRLADPSRRGHGRFTPHLTLCRFAHEQRMERLDRPIAAAPFAVGDVRLMRSVLLPAGAEHRQASVATLGNQ